MPTESDEPLPEAEEKQLCISCMAPNEPSAHFCTKCGAPLSSYASTGPFESLFAEGAVYRQAAGRPRKLIVVLGVWLIFIPMMLSGLAILNAGFGFFGALGGVAIIAVSGAMIWKTTRNYLAWKQAHKRGAV